MNFYMVTDKEITNFTSRLAYVLWNLAVAIAPYDTGNLRRSIILSRNSETKMVFTYNAYFAMYLHYLEMGEGPVKKYKGFIGNETVGQFIATLIYFMKRGDVAGYSSRPSISLKKTETSAQFYEKKIMKKMGVSSETLTADDRRKLSQIRYGTKNRLEKHTDVMKGSMVAKVVRQYNLNERIFR